MRRLRALLLIGGALVAVGVASYAYLRPATLPEVRHDDAVQGSTVVVQGPAQHLNFTGRTDGSYFVWYRGGGSGGHAG